MTMLEYGHHLQEAKYTYLERLEIPIAERLGIHPRCEGSLLNLLIVNAWYSCHGSTTTPSFHARRFRLKAERLSPQEGPAIAL